MKVLVLGASGFIGLPVALAFARAGHIVYGTARDAKTARKLSIHEIIPFVTPATAGHGFSVWGKIAAEVDVIIDTIRSSESETPLAALRGVEEIASRGSAGTKVTYIFTGGAWSHSRGHGGLDKWSSEQLPPTSDLEVAAWQREVEQAVLSSARVNGVVIRPGTLYGRSGSLLEPFLLGPAYDAAKAGREFDAVGLPDTRLLMVHQDDLADLFLRVGERGPLLAGQALVACNSQSERWTDILDAVVRVSGAKGCRLRPPSDKVPAEVAWASTTLLRPTLAHSLTGWTPRKLSLVDGIDMYWPSFVAHYEGKKTIAPWDLPGVVPVGGADVRPPSHRPSLSAKGSGTGSPPRSSPLAG
ncbi:hypothetical protein CcaverHIS002_0601980 [Cutaneotrichosporon cavernicola]|uniref:NAD(P)-binding protein n=1 Tax=Cutaneotrichosporon cavernicola TaxID=279322 RepID=A0AA48QWQ1_9TREE|nr:uncharacterized protein CcaverHIS019_0502090 [Cutaneotrichosporon cavernicola]BEI85911.1 hypothetical protein CcaverHIS002_0601980 [Cutaneotrichosporon cavernicola]BEI92581.1 hypothetical protein CcaverHIS019_0502090 [Cutaneotrichosporon cavernicola]BEJ00355.1 hypothetical protein CcaverHIS631_0502120 [Cutaneotrichosporon cavernicola]BEJ08125.1 hypothetical protein CcaverHIS641_0502100 [Cutaneotrichosporon cavernicola]